MKKHSFLYRNGLSLVFLALFLITITAQALSGWTVYNEELKEKHSYRIAFHSYLKTGHFISATFENFESEFLQMALYVMLTITLRQKGSAESKSLDKEETTDKIPVPSRNAPWPVKKDGLVLKLYSHSLSAAFVLLFIFSWAFHFYGSWRDQNVDNILKHKAQVSIMQFVVEPRFWFETFQNWQSEFLSVLSIVVLTIFLRQKGSPESKPVDAPHAETGK